jgi:hypothetical protein
MRVVFGVVRKAQLKVSNETTASKGFARQYADLHKLKMH